MYITQKRHAPKFFFNGWYSKLPKSSWLVHIGGEMKKTHFNDMEIIHELHNEKKDKVMSTKKEIKQVKKK